MRMNELEIRSDLAGLSGADITACREVIAPYLETLRQVAASSDYSADESSINLPSDTELLRCSAELRDKLSGPELKVVLVIGIGGSDLGTRAVYDAVHGHFDAIDPGRTPRIIFLNTNDPELIERTISYLLRYVRRAEEIVIECVSKSGGTTETIANLEIIMSALVGHIRDLPTRVVIVTDEGSRLWDMAEQKGTFLLPIPKKVGGRFSVLSPVGIFPLLASGSNAPALLQGAQRMRDRCLSSDLSTNPAAVGATSIFSNFKKGRTINDNFFFHVELESLGKWYRQLMGESLGKEHDLEGNVVNTGITPTTSIGSIDLHSVAQLYIGGPRDKFTTFVSAPSKMVGPHRVPEQLFFPGMVESISGKDAETLIEAIYKGTTAAYAKRDLPFMEIVLPEINEFHLGEYVQLKMIEMMFLGRLLNVNTFDQPAVEEYKTETKKVLAGR